MENGKWKNQNYLLAGDSDFLKEEALGKIKTELFLKGLEKNSIERFHAEENTLFQVLDAARTSPLFSSQRLIIYQEMDRLKEPFLQELIQYLKTPQPTSALVLITQDEKFPVSWLEPFKQVCHVQLCQVPYENQLESWITQRVGNAGKKIEIQGARLLKELIGADLRALAVEVEKLILFAQERPWINAVDVEQLAADSIHYSGFVFGDALAAKDLSSALTILSRLLEEKKSVPEAVGLISWQIQRLFHAKQVLEQGGNWDIIARELRINSPFLLRKLQQQLAKWNFPELKEAVRTLLKADTAAKTGQWPSQLVLENWLVSRLL